MGRLNRQNRLSNCKAALATAVAEARRLDTPVLGPDFLSMGVDEVSEALIVHRFVKFSPVVEVDAETRRNQTIQETLKFDREGLIDFSWRDLPQPMRGQFLMAKEFLRVLFTGFRPTYNARFPSGETCVSAMGEVDLLHKLNCSKQWCVSLEAATYVATIMYRSPKLRSLVKERFRATIQCWPHVLRVWWTENPNRFDVFRRMFIAVCHIRAYSRMSTVEKTAEKDRPISMEPLFNMVGQLSLASDLRDTLLRVLGINLDTLADLHRGLIRVPGKATIDFSNASNSNWMVVLRQLWPNNVLRYIEKLRSPVVYVDGQFHHWNMLSPMGCGFTFEVMTLTLLALTRTFDKGSTVFGDDVVIQQDHAPAFISLAQSLGWVVNQQKSFITGSFRESCGAFVDQVSDTSYVSYDFKPISDEIDCCVTANKIGIILRHGIVTKRLRTILAKLWLNIVKELPDVVFRSVDHYPLEIFSGSRVPSSYVIVPNWYYRNRVTRDRTVIENLYGAMYHREVTIGSAYMRMLGEAPRDFTPRQLIAAFLHRGESYTPITRAVGEAKLVLVPVITQGEGIVARMPLLSFF